MRLLPALLILALSPIAALAQDIMIKDAYARASGPMARAGAVFMVIHNHSDKDVTLIGAKSDVARTIELHTHIMEDDVAKMRQIEGGIVIPAGEMHALERGADHVMLMGLTRKLADGDKVELELSFDGADPVNLEVSVDNERKATGGMDHSEHKNH